MRSLDSPDAKRKVPKIQSPQRPFTVQTRSSVAPENSTQSWQSTTSSQSSVRLTDWQQFSNHLQTSSKKKRQEILRAWNDEISALQLQQENVERERDIRDGIFVDPVAPSQPVYESRYKDAHKIRRSPSKWFPGSPLRRSPSPEAPILERPSTVMAFVGVKATRAPPQVGYTRPVSVASHSFDTDYQDVLQSFVVPAVNRRAVEKIVYDDSERLNWMAHTVPYVAPSTSTTTTSRLLTDGSPQEDLSALPSFSAHPHPDFPSRPATSQAHLFADLSSRPGTSQSNLSQQGDPLPTTPTGASGAAERSRPSTSQQQLLAAAHALPLSPIPSSDAASPGSAGGGGPRKSLAPLPSSPAKPLLAPLTVPPSATPSRQSNSTHSPVRAKGRLRRGGGAAQELEAELEVFYKPSEEDESPPALDPRVLNKCSKEELAALEKQTKKDVRATLAHIHQLEVELNQVPHHTRASMYNQTRVELAPSTRQFIHENVVGLANQIPDVKYAMRITKAIHREHMAQQRLDRAMQHRTLKMDRANAMRNRNEDLRQERLERERLIQEEEERVRMEAVRAERQSRWLVVLSTTQASLRFYAKLLWMKRRIQATNTIAKSYRRHRCLRHTHAFCVLHRSLALYAFRWKLRKYSRCMTKILTFTKQYNSHKNMIRIMKVYHYTVRCAQRISREFLAMRHARQEAYQKMWEMSLKKQMSKLKQPPPPKEEPQKTSSYAPNTKSKKKERRPPNPLLKDLERLKPTLLKRVWDERVDEYMRDLERYRKAVADYRREHETVLRQLQFLVPDVEDQLVVNAGRRRFSQLRCHSHVLMWVLIQALLNQRDEFPELLEGITLPPPPPVRPTLNGFITHEDMRALVAEGIDEVKAAAAEAARLKALAEEEAAAAAAAAAEAAKKNRRGRR